MDRGTNQTFFITPAAGYQVSDIFVDGVLFGVSSRVASSAVDQDIRTMTFHNVAANRTLHAEFIRAEGTMLEIRDPAGATVYVDNEERGVTPVTLTDITPGHHAVRLSLEGYQDWSKKVNVVKDTVTTVTAKLSPVQKGSISIESNPEGASIILDGTETGNTTPSVLPSIEPGEHTIGLIRLGYAVWDKTFEVRSNAMVHVLANLRKGLKLF
jgi:hypothetical protein